MVAAEHVWKSIKGWLQGSPDPVACTVICRVPLRNPLPHVAEQSPKFHGPYWQSTVKKSKQGSFEALLAKEPDAPTKPNDL